MTPQICTVLRDAADLIERQQAALREHGIETELTATPDGKLLGDIAMLRQEIGELRAEMQHIGIKRAEPQPQFTVQDACKELYIAEDWARRRSKDPVLCRERHRLWRRLHAGGWTAARIGREFGYNHTTVLYALGRVERKPHEIIKHR